ncbi:TPA: threonine--tRNA ligase, partial [Candidatus Poribacteria bacterium]|nr:threonine--tRNA ligase [Candidatus Poribacteria bacterium]
ATNQVDFAIPERFDLIYIDEDGSGKTPICIHRAPLGTHERFIGFLIEHFGGNFPLWLAPVQVAVLPVSDKVLAYAQQVKGSLFEAGIRVNLNERADKIGAKIRHAELNKVNVMLIVGTKEAENGTVSVRRRFEGDLGPVRLETLIPELKDEIKDRSVTHRQEADAETQ